MNHKVLGSVFVLAVALGIISVAVRAPQTTPAKAPVASEPVAAPAAPADAPVMRKNVPHLDRAAASYRVYEYGIERGMDFRGARYNARVAETEVRFGNSDGSLLLGTPKFDQGAKTVVGDAPVFSHPSFGVARLERGPVAEEYVFENNRMEQLFHIPAALGEGALTVRVPLATTFPSVIETRKPNSGKFDAVEFRDGGIAIMDPTGAVRFSCTSAVVLDSAKNRLTLAPRHEHGEIVMEIPASYMAKAVYPVVVDPWFSDGNSNTAGISNSTGASERPSMKDNVIAWADHSTGNFEIYLKVWDGTNFGELNGSASGGGVSSNAGDSVNPSVVADGSGSPTVAWEDTSGGPRSIYCKQYPPRGKGTSFSELAGSASNLGLSGSFGSNKHPTVGLLKGRIPGAVTLDVNQNPVSAPSTTVPCPVVAWEAGAVFVSAFYPGAPAIPQIGNNPALPAVPAGWYQLGTVNGQNVDKDNFNQAINIGGGAYPSLVVDSNNEITIAFESGFNIFATRWTHNAIVPPATTDFQVIAFSTSRNDMLPPSNFRGIETPGSPVDPVSGPGLHQYPAICQDDFGGVNIVWQATESLPTNPAISQQVYLAHNDGLSGDPWGPLGGSMALGGISQTGLAYNGGGLLPPVAGNATHPAVGAGGNYIAVAWEDTSNSRSAIYVRRLAFTGPGALSWDQVGFQGSAFPPRLPLAAPPTVPEQAPINGVSQSSNFALQPQIQLDGDGSPLVAWADGSATTFDILTADFDPNGPGQAVGIGTQSPTFQLTIRQTSDAPTPTGGGTNVAIGDFTVGTSIWLSSRVFTETLIPPGTNLWLEFEIQPAGVPFTLTPTHQSLFVTPDAPPATIPPAYVPSSMTALKFDGLPNTNYHYITRSIDQLGRHSRWIEQTTIGGISFRVNAAAPPGGGSNGPANTTPITAGNTSHKGNCGLLGMEAVALLGLIRIIRLRSSK